MSKPVKLEIVKGKDRTLDGKSSLDIRQKRIATYHAGVLKATAEQFVYITLCGVELIAAKAEIEHGQFMKWVEDSFTDLTGFSHRTATKYMAFVERIHDKLASLGEIASGRLQLTNGELPAKEKKELLEAVREYADGKTITDLYREMDVIPKPKPKEYHPPTLTDEEKLAAEEKASAEFVQNTANDVAVITEEDATWVKASDASLKQLFDACLGFTKKFRELKKSKKKVARGSRRAGKGGAK